LYLDIKTDSIVLYLGIISLSNLDYATPSFWISKEILLPYHNWTMQIIAVQNTASRLRLNNHNPTWVRDLARDIPEANWRHKNVSNDPILGPPPKKFGKVPLDYHIHTLNYNLPNRIQPTLCQKST